MGLDSVEIVMEAERLFNLELPDELITNIYTFGAFVDCVHNESQRLGRTIDRLEIETTLRKMVSDHLGILESKIQLESRFIEDLGMQ